MPVDRDAIARRLERLIPLLAPHTPEGWVDFRDAELSKEWRGGIFLRSEEETEPGFIELKALFGCRAAAMLASLQICAISVNYPALVQGGETEIWSVWLKIPEEAVTW